MGVTRRAFVVGRVCCGPACCHGRPLGAAYRSGHIAAFPFSDAFPLPNPYFHPHACRDGYSYPRPYPCMLARRRENRQRQPAFSFSLVSHAGAGVSAALL